MDSIASFFSNHNIIKKVILKGSLRVGLSFKIILLFTIISILAWVTLNDGHTKISDQFKSTVDLKVKGGLNTNYTAKDFVNVYVKPYEYENYNRQWDSIDYSFESSNEIGIMTNMVITANQTQGLCPEHPNTIGAVCNKMDNKCVNGALSYHGTRTGECVDADFPYREDYDKPWKNVSTCQIIGWCPVERVLPPLRGNKAVLLQTIKTTLHIQSTVYFTDYKIIKSSLNYSTLNQEYVLSCRYHPESDPLCPTFALKDIINLTPNAGMSYEQMAYSGGVIVITINWDCRIGGWIRKNYNTLYDCKPDYAFARVDEYKHDDQITYRFARYFNGGKMRTHYRSWRIRFVVNPKVTVREFNFYRFLTSLLAYNGVIALITFVFNKIIAKIYSNKNWDEEIYLSDMSPDCVKIEINSSLNDNNEHEHQQYNHIDEDNSDSEKSMETTPLLA